MAIIKCPICGNEISSSDTKCIKCGSDQYTIQFELKKQELIKTGKIKDNSKKKNLIIITIELVLIAIFFSLYIFLFLPRIFNIRTSNVNREREKKCTENSGNWDSDLNRCIEES